MSIKSQLKKPKKQNKTSLIQARVSIKEHQEIITKAIMYANGKQGEFVRMACLGYRPITKIEKSK